jgi:hypothetical protein
MSNVKVGEVSFESIEWNSDSSASLFMKLDEGDNTVRILSNPIQYYETWVTDANGKKRSFNTPTESPELVRKLEDAGFKRTTKWMFKVLDRSDNKLKIMKVGSQIMKGVTTLYENKKWGPLHKYDITIRRGRPNDKPLYTVVPEPVEPLDKSFKAQFDDFNERIDVMKFITPAAAKDVCDFLGWPLVKSGAPSKQAQASAPDEGEEASGDDFEFSF